MPAMTPPLRRPLQVSACMSSHKCCQMAGTAGILVAGGSSLLEHWQAPGRRSAAVTHVLVTCRLMEMCQRTPEGFRWGHGQGYS